jgi:hypothetical protein
MFSLLNKYALSNNLTTSVSANRLAKITQAKRVLNNNNIREVYHLGGSK